MTVLLEDGAQATVPDFDKAIAELDQQDYGQPGATATKPEDPAGAKPQDGATQKPDEQPNAASTTADAGAPKDGATAPGKEDEGEERPTGEVKPEAPAPVFAIPEEVRTLLPAEVKDAAGLAAHIKTLSENFQAEHKANEEFVGMLETNPLLLDVMQDMRKNGTSFFEAATKAMQIGEGESVPDPTTPEGKEFVRKQIAIEEARKRQKADDAEHGKQVKAAEQHAVSMRTAFREANKDITDTRFNEFITWIKGVTLGDASGRLPQNFFPAMWKAFSYDEKISKARDEARIAGRNEALHQTTRNMNKPTSGDGLPHFQGGKEPATTKDALSDLEESLRSDRIFES